MAAVIPTKLAEIKRLASTAVFLAPKEGTSKPKLREVRAILYIMQQMEEVVKETITLLTDPLSGDVAVLAGDVTSALIHLGATPEEAEEAVRYALQVDTMREFDALYNAAQEAIRTKKEGVAA